MASLFDNLPAPTGRKRQDVVDEYKPAPAQLLPPEPVEDEREAADGSEGEDYPGERPEKRQRVQGDEQDLGSRHRASDDGGAPEGGPSASDALQEQQEQQLAAAIPTDQVAAALKKIASHISNPDKFGKASGLFRQLLDGGTLGRQHRDGAFEVVRAAFEDIDNASEASLRRDYMKLCHTLEKHSELFSRAQRTHLEVRTCVCAGPRRHDTRTPRAHRRMHACTPVHMRPGAIAHCACSMTIQTSRTHACSMRIGHAGASDCTMLAAVQRRHCVRPPSPPSGAGPGCIATAVHADPGQC